MGKRKWSSLYSLKQCGNVNVIQVGQNNSECRQQSTSYREKRNLPPFEQPLSRNSEQWLYVGGKGVFASLQFQQEGNTHN